MKSTGIVFSGRNYIGSAEPPATVLEDESRWGNDGAFAGDGSPDWVQLPSGLWVMSFDGSTSLVSIGDVLDIAYDTPQTYMAWIKTTGNGLIAIICKHDAGSPYQGWSFRVASTGIGYDYVGATGRLYATTTTTTVTDDAWHFVMASKGDETEANLELYVDTILQGKSVASDTLAATADDKGAPLQIGARDTTLELFPGLIALPKILSYTFSAGQGKKIFESERYWFGV